MRPNFKVHDVLLHHHMVIRATWSRNCTAPSGFLVLVGNCFDFLDIVMATSRVIVDSRGKLGVYIIKKCQVEERQLLTSGGRADPAFAVAWHQRRIGE